MYAYEMGFFTFIIFENVLIFTIVVGNNYKKDKVLQKLK
jgi:hypothetical protein